MKVVVVCSPDVTPSNIEAYLPPGTTEVIPVPPKSAATLKVGSADMVLVFWDGKDRRTKRVIDNCDKTGIPKRIFV